jgi:hypothetical protein
MMYFLRFAFVLLVCFSCTKKNYLERSNEAAALADAIKQLEKKSDDAPALEAVPELYKRIRQHQLKQIESYNTQNDLSKWDKIIGSYEVLQKAHDQIIGNAAASRLVTPENFNVQLLEAKQTAADAYYNEGNRYLSLNGRSNAKSAYNAFLKTQKYLPDYYNIESKIDEAFEKGTINLIVNSIVDNSYFMNNGWGSYGYNYSNEYFQDKLVRDLVTNKQPLIVYSDYQATRQHIVADWDVTLVLRDIDIPYPQQRTYTRQASKSIETGTDTSGRPIYQTIYATVHVTENSFTARGVMDVDIRDLYNRKTINNTTFREEYRWVNETGRYTGDSRALSSADWAIINNRNTQTVRKEDVLEEIYKKMYPRVLSYVKRYTQW